MDDFNALREKAKAFAIRAHGDQKYGDKPYSYHLNLVEQALGRYNLAGTVDLMVAVWLHDTLEDTSVTREEMEKEFGKEVTDLVFSVTDEPGKNRKEKHTLTYPKTKAHPLGVTLKLADRIVNVEESCQNNPGKLAMYKKEYPEFRKALISNDPRTLPMWDRLDILLGEK